MAKCKQCKSPNANYKPPGLLTKFCDMQCCIAYARDQSSKNWKTETRRRKKVLLSEDKSHWREQAQIAVNAWIRWRDRNKRCMSCDKRTGCKVNAGHYKSVGSYPELRYHPLNIHLQCEHCNCHLSGNIIEYRKNLVLKIGIKRVLWLEGPHKQPKYTLDELKYIHKKYKHKLKNARLIHGNN